MPNSKPRKLGPRKTDPPERPSVEAGLREGWTRRTVVLRKDTLDTLKALAFFDRRTMGEELDHALAWFFKQREAELPEAEALYKQRALDVSDDE